MKHRMSMGVALSVLLVTLAGCTDSSQPLGPSAPPGKPTVPSTTPDFPSLTRNTITYDRRSSSFIPGVSRYAVYDDSTFSLQYVTPAFGFFEYPGTSSRSDSVINFKFEGWSIWGPWLASGVVHGDSLTVKYNVVMVMSDFEDGVYVRTGK